MIARELETPSVKRSTSLEPPATFGCPANWTAYGLFLVQCYSDPYVGLAKAHLQHVITATAMNLSRLAAWLAGVPHGRTRVSQFARLALAG